MATTSATRAAHRLDALLASEIEASVAIVREQGEVPDVVETGWCRSRQLQDRDPGRPRPRTTAIPDR